MYAAGALATALPMIFEEVEVLHVERISPSFVRVALGGPALADLGVDGPWRDQRVKLVFPASTGSLPPLGAMALAGEDWWAGWQQLPEDERGAMRTYTVRDVVGDGPRTRLVVDIVVHEPAAGGEPDGVGNRWALGARAGDRVVLMAPRRGHDFGGIEWSPGTATRLLLAGDETAVPAIRGILRDLPDDATGAAFLEVPVGADVQVDVRAPAGVEVTWLPRDGSPRGAGLHGAVLAWLEGAPAPEALLGVAEVAEDEVDSGLWETPVYSSSGDRVLPSTAVPGEGSPYAGLYAWIAGESKVVTGLRRKLVSDLGLGRGQVAFMGYWREGVAMKG